jgi:DNA-binding protein YbaB
VRANRAKKKEHLGKKALEKQAAREQRAIQKAQEQASREEMEAGAPAGEIEVQDNGPDFENMTEEEFMDWRAVGPSP